MRPFHKLCIVFGSLAGLLLLAALLVGNPDPVQASEGGAGFHAGGNPVNRVWLQQDEPGSFSPDDQNAECYACHAQPGMQTTLPSGEILYLTVSPQVFNDSVHGMQDFACQDCHVDITGFPHPENTAQTLREYELQQYQTCETCHQAYAEETQDSVHSAALEAGNENAAVCTDCHGAHNVQPPGEPRSNIPLMCRQCHSEIHNQYKDSVHGAALIGEGNPDVPTCTDCHGVHSVQGPSVDEAFRLYSPLICADCHADEELMSQYGISTNVFDSYISDFHGTTTLLFAQTSEGQDFNTPVCIDCHGVHDIAAGDDPEKSLQVKENLLAKCQQCHPDASTNFPDAWLGHYEPSPEKFPLVYYVNLFYRFFIPGVLAFMIVLVAADFGRKVYDRFRPDEPDKPDERHAAEEPVDAAVDVAPVSKPGVAETAPPEEQTLVADAPPDEPPGTESASPGEQASADTLPTDMQGAEDEEPARGPSAAQDASAEAPESDEDPQTGEQEAKNE
jgi:predicted CXXCH cytochrome family protein